MKKLFLVAFLLCLAGLNAQADSSRSINYHGQNTDSFELDLMTEITRYREEQVPSTCTRDVPYTARECGYETRYRQECRTEPGRNVCRTVNQQVCRNETRTRQECTTVPRQVCRDENGRRVCRTDGTRQQCRNVPYTERVCRNEPRQVCDYQPPRQVCSNVPYQEYICRDVTRYRRETYACMRTIQVPYTVERENTAEVEVNYSDANSTGSNANLAFSLDRAGNVSLNLTERSSNPALAFVTKTQNVANHDDNLTTNARFNVSFVAKNAYLAPVSNDIQATSLDQRRLVLKSAQIVRPQDLRIKLKIKKKGFLGMGRYSYEKVLTSAQFSVSNAQGASFATIDFANVGASLKDKKYEFTVTYILEPGSALVTPVGANTEKQIQFERDL